MTLESIDPVALGLSHMIRVARLVERCKEHVNLNWRGKEKGKPKVVGRAISRRAKDLPSLMASAGLVPSLTFYMSKAGGNGGNDGKEELYTTIYKYLTVRGDEVSLLNQLLNMCLTISGKTTRPGSLISEIEEDKGGYTIILASVAAAMKELNLIGNHDPSTLRGLAKILLELHNDAVRELMAEQLLLEYLEEAKKLAEAFFTGKQEEAMNHGV